MGTPSAGYQPVGILSAGSQAGQARRLYWAARPPPGTVVLFLFFILCFVFLLGGVAVSILCFGFCVFMFAFLIV